MQQLNLTLPVITLIGIETRTNNTFETNPMTSKIGPCAQRYGQEQLFNKITNRKNPGTTFCAYTDYESDHTGDYTFFIGEEIDADIAESYVPAEGLKKHVIPAQNYAKFTTESGPMPFVAISAWQKIWQMTPDDLGGKRSFQNDFQIHDERSVNPMSTILDIYVGISDM
ncbi:MAG: GyrI-like domain-containing protein [Pseudomonadota bacterium]